MGGQTGCALLVYTTWGKIVEAASAIGATAF